MMVQAFGASAFGLRGGIPMIMKAAQTNAITRLHRVPTLRDRLEYP